MANGNDNTGADSGLSAAAGSRLAARLRELSDAVTQGREAVLREFGMRVPAEPDRDADIVLDRAADRIETLEDELRNIANVKPSEWGDMSDQFQPWAQNRARAILSENDQEH